MDMITIFATVSYRKGAPQCGYDYYICYCKLSQRSRNMDMITIFATVSYRRGAAMWI